MTLINTSPEYNMKRSKKHQKLVDNYEKQKSRQLEKLATKSLEIDEKNSILKSKQIKGDFLKNF